MKAKMAGTLSLSIIALIIGIFLLFSGMKGVIEVNILSRDYETELSGGGKMLHLTKDGIHHAVAYKNNETQMPATSPSHLPFRWLPP